MADFYVSTAGNDAQSGRSADPAGAFRSPARAQAAMRANPGNDTVHIRGGTYTLDAPLSLTAADAGSSFVAYAGERPVLSGGTAVTNWQPGADGVWTAKLGLSDVRQLTLGGTAQIEARYPNYDAADPARRGWLLANTLPSGRDSRYEMAYDKSELSASQVAPGQRVTVFSEADYSNDTLVIESVDTNAGTIRFSEFLDYPIGPESRFFVSGDRPHLDQPGEWWFDKPSRTLFYKAPPGFDGSNTVAAGGDKTLIRIDGTSAVAIRGLTFTDVTTTAQTDDIDTAAVVIASSTGVTVDGNRFTNVAKGVLIDGGSHGNTVSGNDLTRIGAAAVDLTPGTYENLITDNIISRVGTQFRSAPAVSLVETWGNTISHNRIQDVPRFGISEGHYDNGQRSGDNLIEYNEVLRSGRETSETSAIYLFHGSDGSALGSTIRYNRIVDTGAAGIGREFSWGIVLDDFTSRAKVHGNFVSGTVLGGVNVHGGRDNEIYNNVLLNNRKIGLYVQEVDGGAMPGNTFHHNIVQIPNDEPTAVIANPDLISPASFYDNIYLNPTGVAPEFDDFIPFARWQSMGGDRGSDVVASVGFANPAAGDYSFAPNSFALTQGIQPLPFGLIGPTRSQAATPAPAPVATPEPASPAPVTTPDAGVRVVQGTGGNDVLRDGAGPDRLVGGAGADTFVFADASTSGVPDEVADFVVGVDQLQLSRMFFDAAGGSVDLEAGPLSQQGAHFITNLTGEAARSQYAQLIYETDTGTLWWDPDGTGSNPRATVATLLGAPALGAGDIFLV